MANLSEEARSLINRELGFVATVCPDGTPNLSPKGTVASGTAELHSEGEVFDRGVRFYEQRGTVRARDRIRHIVIVAVERFAVVTSPAYDIGLTEQQLRATHLERLNRQFPTTGA